MVKKNLSSSDKHKERVQELVDKDLLKPEQVDGLSKMIDSPDKENLTVAKEIININISTGLKVGLNEDQSKAFDDMLSFIEDPQADAFVLKGYAGTGKTFLVKRIIEYITTTHDKHKIAITAPTNKAVRVLQSDTPFDSDNGGPVFKDIHDGHSRLTYSTIHKLLGLKEVISNTGVQSFTPDKMDKNDITRYRYLIVDEVSMLDDTICKALLDYSKDIRIIFMGDPAQIPPVNRTDCIPFREQKEYVFQKAELKKIMRQTGEHPVVDASFLIRNNLNVGQPIPKLETTLNAEGKGIIYIDGITERKKVRPILEEYFNNDKFKANADYAKVIAWKNKTVNYLNAIVRQILYGNDAMTYMVGEKLVARGPIFKPQQDKFWGGNKWVVGINTSEEMEVEDVVVTTKKFVEGSHQLYATVYKCDVKIWQPIEKKFIKDEIFIIHEDSRAEYNKLVKETKAFAVQAKKSQAWVTYYNILKWSADVSYNYAITAHKAQGSTYTNVILLEEDIDLNKKILERNRIKYTSYSRPTDKLFILRKNYAK